MTNFPPALTMQTYGEANLRLGKIEAEEDITILFAVESGSRAWGFPSPDSDFDVRFFYTRPMSRYLGLASPPDVVKRPIEGPWDIEGWDLRKALQLVVKGNATVTEWLSSPLIYRELGPFPAKFRTLVKTHASVEGSARHYYGLTKNCYHAEIANRTEADMVLEHEALGKEIKGLTKVNLKKYLYAIRGACSLEWIRKFNEIPPMTLPALLAQDIVPPQVRSEIERLLRIKATMGEMGEGLRIKALDDYVEERIEWARANKLDQFPVSPQFVAASEELLLHALGV